MSFTGDLQRRVRLLALQALPRDWGLSDGMCLWALKLAKTRALLLEFEVSAAAQD